ncbi:DUF1189 family protein [Streptococcus sp. HMSC078D09]|uniref:DUF1189 family protein n=1 Tax=Streptococcus sp. HMSC078D09 TaxID=1739430 RepID=UPI0008A1FD0E|nr:DUF1189 family protein [Streptococcus sp. HMSC078D09]OFQ62592.1 maltodextrose utilization protein MalA [Streptococcus sp. HMSC078D09]
MPYPFNYFASIFNFRSSFANRKKLSWFQMIFTSFFLISVTLLPVALQNAQLKTYPLTTFVSDVFDLLSNDVMKDIQEHVVIKDQVLTYIGTNPVHKTSKGQVVLGQETTASESKELTLHFDRKQLIISKENKELATISYQAINQESLRDKKSFTQAISSDWFRENRLPVSLFLVIFSGFLSTVNYLILIVGASFFLYLTRKSRLFSLQTFKECFNCILNCLGLPILLSVLISLLFHQVFTTTIMIQNVLFVLYLAMVFYKTHFRDPDYHR